MPVRGHRSVRISRSGRLLQAPGNRCRRGMVVTSASQDAGHTEPGLQADWQYDEGRPAKPAGRPARLQDITECIGRFCAAWLGASGLARDARAM